MFALCGVHSLGELFADFEFPALAPAASEGWLLIGLGWWTIVNRQAAAIAALEAFGMSGEALPNARSALEHAIALVVLSRRDEAALPDGLIRGTLEDLTRGAKARPLDEDPVSIRVIDALAGEVSQFEGDWPQRFDSQVRLLGVRPAVYSFYVGLCMYTHPTFNGAIAFTDWLNGFQPRSVPDLSVTRGVAGTPILWAVQCQCWAGLALDRLLPDGLTFRNELLQVAGDLDVPLIPELFPEAGT